MTLNSNNPITCFLQYVIGVPRKYMCEEEYIALGEIQRLRAMRRLCQLRTQIIRNFAEVTAEYKNGYYFDNIRQTSVPYKCLCEEGIRLEKQDNVSKEVIQLNNWIYGYADDVMKYLEPELDSETPIEWMKELILMPNGNAVEGVRAAVKTYQDRKNNYPYQMYLNWEFGLSTIEQQQLNLLRSDETFLLELRSRHMSLGNNDEAKKFCEEAKNLVAIIDCENVTPQKLYSMMVECDKLKKVVMVNDENSSVLWSDFAVLMEKRVTVEHIMTDRMNKAKSVADLVVVARIMREYYEGHADRIIICSSDSDYLSIIETLPNVKFAVALEQIKTSHAYVEKLVERQVQIWSLDVYNDEKNSPLLIYAADRMGCLLAKFTLNLDDIANQVECQLHLRSPEILDDLKAKWLSSAALIKDSERRTISITIKEHSDETPSNCDNSEEDEDITKEKTTKKNKKTKKKAKKAKKKKRR